MMKGYTDIEQSKKLAEILPIESADMEYMFLKRDGSIVSTVPFIKDGYEESDCSYNFVHCWSLEALLNYLREIDIFPEIDADKFMVTMNISYYEGSLLTPVHNIKVQAESFIDACVEMIYKLKENNLL